MRFKHWKRSMALVAVASLVLAACGEGDEEGDTEVGDEAAADDEADEPVELAQGVTDDEIVIAGFGPQTGPASWIGLGTRDGFDLAVEEINEAGGIHGRQLSVEWFDDQNDVAFTQTILRRITGEVKPFMVFSGTGSTVFVSVSDDLRESGLPIYNGFSGSPAARKNPEVDTVFHGQAVAATWVIEDLISLVDDLGTTRVSVLHDVGEWGRSVCEPTIEKLESELGLAPDTIQTYTVGDTDFSGQLVALRNADPEVIINCGHFPEAAVILQQARESGVDALVIGDTAQGNASVWERAGSSAENFIFNWYSPVFLTDPEGPMADFRERYAAKYPDAPAGRPAHSDTFAYGDAYIIAEALEKAGPNLTVEAFLEAMNDLDGFQPSPINATVATFDNDQNDAFQKTAWMRVVDGNAVLVDDAQMAELQEIVANS